MPQRYRCPCLVLLGSGLSGGGNRKANGGKAGVELVVGRLHEDIVADNHGRHTALSGERFDIGGRVFIGLDIVLDPRQLKLRQAVARTLDIRAVTLARIHDDFGLVHSVVSLWLAWRRSNTRVISSAS